MSRLIGDIVSAKMADLHELQTIYSLEDAYNLYEILQVDLYNQYLGESIQ